ncbi:MAG: hypothetical protein JOZ05_18765 [Acetobacteraceae bacterium]|nr:hypothetical protein [Acetobacteraceae bacterium]
MSEADSSRVRAEPRSFGDDYRDRLVALGRAQERGASTAREEVQQARREVEESRPAEAARRGRRR